MGLARPQPQPAPDAMRHFSSYAEVGEGGSLLRFCPGCCEDEARRVGGQLVIGIDVGEVPFKRVAVEALTQGNALADGVVWQ